jgi:hypothetical protein
MKLVCKTIFGSRLYGTATPTSDIDVRGIFVPSKVDVLLGRIPRTNRDQEAGKEEDYELYSLHHFVHLACQGQTVAFDMLWTPANQVELGEAGEIWESLVEERHRFLSKRMNAFIGYARGQAAKYSLKGQRLSKLEAFLGVLMTAHGDDLLGHCLANDALPVCYDDSRINVQGVKEIQIAGKWFGATTQVRYVMDSIQRTIDGYGIRANSAARDGGVDWKAMSHAVRVSMELRDLLTEGHIRFPLQEANMLIAIKTGQYTLQNVQVMLDVLLEQVEALAAKSSLPEEVDREYWDSWLLSKMLYEVRR